MFLTVTSFVFFFNLSPLIFFIIKRKFLWILHPRVYKHLFVRFFFFSPLFFLWLLLLLLKTNWKPVLYFCTNERLQMRMSVSHLQCFPPQTFGLPEFYVDVCMCCDKRSNTSMGKHVSCPCAFLQRNVTSRDSAHNRP